MSQSVRFKLFQEKKKQIKKKTTFGKKKKTERKSQKWGEKWEIGSLVPWSFSKTAYYTAFLKTLCFKFFRTFSQ